LARPSCRFTHSLAAVARLCFHWCFTSAIPCCNGIGCIGHIPISGGFSDDFTGDWADLHKPGPRSCSCSRFWSRQSYDSTSQFSAKLSFQCHITPVQFLPKSSLKIAFSGKAMLPGRGKTMGKPTRQPGLGSAASPWPAPGSQPDDGGQGPDAGRSLHHAPLP